MEQLPKANIILLRNVFEMLHSIEQQSASNQMTAFNLAVCIAPSMLWPPYSATPQLENKFIEKILLLAQYIIENCGRIFAEEATSLLSYDRDNASEETTLIQESESANQETVRDPSQGSIATPETPSAVLETTELT
uniref:Rho GTPase-activating protein 20-like isoform X2 n=1 Tax=Phascolarctos cinereus TaxID=38626 RepID=A0A6P5JVK8_PHACI|nr:rho GTPase-activating protein 20-like isoform X2 [Phascolarctos cinereus]